jgi:glutamine amidotransferase
MGNIRSVSKALEHLGGTVSVSDQPDALAKADKIVLPGVGAFGDAIAELKKRNLF